MLPEDQAKLIAEYERLRKRLHELTVQAEHIDRRLIQIERQLPDHFTFPGDPPLGDSPLDDNPDRPARPRVRWDDAD